MQVWESCDKREWGRRVVVERVEGEYAVCRGWADGMPKSPRRRIRLDRFRPNATGYKLVRA
jgi:hypothetical protein